MMVVVPKFSEALSLAACMARWRRDGATAMRACAPESGLGSGNFGSMVPGLATGRGGGRVGQERPCPRPTNSSPGPDPAMESGAYLPAPERVEPRRESILQKNQTHMAQICPAAMMSTAAVSSQS
uniref:Uncharacterized protein n=1 Tax=Oryza sativa subsp. japonica TaxID=39947 RepID=Q84J47_ORYSJ|nr:hypothetical protein [Oryza sativa Japonica Group]BAD31673.1 hypothetical protein [Oryza sativa Japonica Group]